MYITRVQALLRIRLDQAADLNTASVIWKRLRGASLDLFGHPAERRMERRLVADYEAGVDRLVAGLTRERLALAVKIAEAPQQIRGFERGGSPTPRRALSLTHGRV